MLFDDFCLAQENRATDPVLHKLMRSPQNSPAFPFRKNQLLRVLACFVFDLCHDLLGATQKCREAVAIGLHILDRSCCNAGLCRRGCDGRGDIEQDPLINRFRDQILRTELNGLPTIGISDRVGHNFTRQFSNRP